ncbi:uncharacterized protein LOC135497274 [Lineus longissimus]|uniref:uncharacterized protein LOC135497274 n=1 Tax=Lineus longissimus TaxID=88925 RepID=UPI002B4E83DA
MKYLIVCLSIVMAIALTDAMTVADQAVESVLEEFKCPDSFTKEDTKYVLRTSGESCGITYCDQSDASMSGLICPLMMVDNSVCARAKLQDEGCYYADVKDLTTVYPGCCTYYKKFCKNDAGFDDSKVPSVPTQVRLDSNCISNE